MAAPSQRQCHGAGRDAQLTDLGKEQARDLQGRTAALGGVEVLVVSPMRRAIQTGLLAFEEQVARGLPVVATEAAHEIAGRHTCDCRLPLADLAAQFPTVDFSGVGSEEDPFWGDGRSVNKEGGKRVFFCGGGGGAEPPLGHILQHALFPLERPSAAIETTSAHAPTGPRLVPRRQCCPEHARTMPT